MPAEASSSGGRTGKGTLPISDGGNSLPGGLIGFGNHAWAPKAVRGNGTAGVQLAGQFSS